MNLGQMRLEVRRAIAELTADFWSDSEINDWLNEGAKIMVSNAQSVQAIYQRNTVASQQEYPLPEDIDEIVNVTYFDSAEHPLDPVDPRQVQIGSNQTGTPRWFYLRKTTQYGNMASTGITVSDANEQQGMNAEQVLGLFPVPNAAKALTVFYISRHFQMKNDGAVPNIPPEFRRGIIAYATALAKEKEMAYGDADRHRKMFQDFSDRLREKSIYDGQQIAFPCVQTDEDRVPYGDVIIKFGRAT